MEKPEHKMVVIGFVTNNSDLALVYIRSFKDLLERLGEKVVRTRMPGGCPISEQVRTLLIENKENNMCLGFTQSLIRGAAMQTEKDVMTPALVAGKIVLCLYEYESVDYATHKSHVFFLDYGESFDKDFASLRKWETPGRYRDYCASHPDERWTRIEVDSELPINEIILVQAVRKFVPFTADVIRGWPPSP